MTTDHSNPNLITEIKNNFPTYILDSSESLCKMIKHSSQVKQGQVSSVGV